MFWSLWQIGLIPIYNIEMADPTLILLVGSEILAVGEIGLKKYLTHRRKMIEEGHEDALISSRVKNLPNLFHETVALFYDMVKCMRTKNPTPMKYPQKNPRERRRSLNDLVK
jgi:Tat protein secretion system quality control protein TatD with DNase activity